MAGLNNVPPKAKNLLVSGGLAGFVFGVYFYTMRAVAGIDEVQFAIDLMEEEKREKEAREAAMASKKA